MKKVPMETSVQVVETTLGDLVELVTQLALETGCSQQECYRLASLALAKLIRDHGVPHVHHTHA